MPIIVILFSFNYNRNVKKDKVKIAVNNISANTIRRRNKNGKSSSWCKLGR